MPSFVKFSAIYLLIIGIFSCSANHLSPNVAPPSRNNLVSCNHVITETKINAFNQKQSKFSLIGGGATSYCKEEVEINGKSNHIEVKGYSAIGILPEIKYLKTDLDLITNDHLIYFHLVFPTLDDAKYILQDMGLPFLSGAESNFYISNSDFPSYLRFGKGSLFHVRRYNLTRIDNQNVLIMNISTSPEEKPILDRKIQIFIGTNDPLELFWPSKSDKLARQIAFNNQDSNTWSYVSTESLIHSIIHDSAYSINNQASMAINWVHWLNLNANQIHNSFPELYDIAIKQWQNPTVTESNATSLIGFLKYIVKVNPNSFLKSTLDTFNIINTYQTDYKASLNFTLEYIKEKTWTNNQFNLIVKVADLLHNSINRKSWVLAFAITKKSQFDETLSLLAAHIGINLKQRNLILESNINGSIENIFTKIQLGLSSSNMKLYFQTFDSYLNQLGMKPTEAEKTCDDLVLNKKLNENNQSFYLDLMIWLRQIGHFDYHNTHNLIKNLTAKKNLDKPQLRLIQDTFFWINHFTNLSNLEALNKTAYYLDYMNFDLETLKQLQTYTIWLNQSIPLSQKEAIAKAEETIINNAASFEQTQMILKLTAWYTNKMGLNSQTALTYAENLSLQQNMNSSQVELLMDLTYWLFSYLNLSQNEAVNRGKSFFSTQNSISSMQVELLKSLVQWIHSNLADTQSSALEKSERLIFNLRISPDQVELMKDAIKWLKYSVNLSGTQALEKWELYLIKGKFDYYRFERLKSEYYLQVRANLTSLKALEMAEQKVLGLSH